MLSLVIWKYPRNLMFSMLNVRSSLSAGSFCLTKLCIKFNIIKDMIVVVDGRAA